MSKTKPKPPQQFNQPKSSTRAPSRDDGYTPLEERKDLAGYWVPERGPIHGKVVDAFQFVQRNGKGRGQTQTVYILDLAEPCIALAKVEGGGKEEVTLEARELCGVMQTYGLRQLVTLGGAFVKIERLGKRTLGNGNETWSYSIGYKGKGTTLNVRPPAPVAPAHSRTNGTREPGDDSEEVAADELPF